MPTGLPSSYKGNNKAERAPPSACGASNSNSSIRCVQVPSGGRASSLFIDGPACRCCGSICCAPFGTTTMLMELSMSRSSTASRRTSQPVHCSRWPAANATSWSACNRDNEARSISAMAWITCFWRSSMCAMCCVGSRARLGPPDGLGWPVLSRSRCNTMRRCAVTARPVAASNAANAPSAATRRGVPPVLAGVMTSRVHGPSVPGVFRSRLTDTPSQVSVPWCQRWAFGCAVVAGAIAAYASDARPLEQRTALPEPSCRHHAASFGLGWSPCHR